VSSPQKSRDDDRRGRLPLSWLRMYALVLEFLAYLGVLGYIGWWLEQRYGWQPWGLLGGLLLGLAVGLYRMIRESRQVGS
jgi:F0F1-type ATP synthase assembly protein I